MRRVQTALQTASPESVLKMLRQKIQARKEEIQCELRIAIYLTTFDLVLFCEMCGAKSPGRLEVHHVTTRGHGGGLRLDTALNLVALCPGLYGGQCHAKYGDDPAYLPEFLKIVAKREGLEPDDVERAIYKLRRQPKRMW